MKGGIFCWALVLTFVAAASTTAAQQTAPASGAAAKVDSTVQLKPVTRDLLTPAAPLLLSSTGAEPVTVGASHRPAPSGAFVLQDSTGIKHFFFGSQRRTSNTLIIGGVGVAVLGVGVVKGHAGAILGVAGLLASIGGLYLAF